MENMERIYNLAHKAGIAAVEAVTPKPMIVTERRYLPSGESYIYEYPPIESGVCGFAWIDVRPRNGEMARWLKKHDLARNSDYDKSMKIWVIGYGQSYDRKTAYAGAFAAVLQEHGIRAYSGQRLD